MSEISERLPVQKNQNQEGRLNNALNQADKLRDGLEEPKTEKLTGVDFKNSTITKEGKELMKRFKISFKNNILYVNGKSVMEYNDLTAKIEIRVGENNTLIIKSTDKPKNGKRGAVETYFVNQFDSGLNLYLKENRRYHRSFPKGENEMEKSSNTLDLSLINGEIMKTRI